MFILFKNTYIIIFNMLFLICRELYKFVFISQLLSCVRLFEALWAAAHQVLLFFTISWSLPKFMSIESVSSSVSSVSHLSHPLCPLLLLPSIYPSIRVFFNDLALRISWPKYWSFSISCSNKH